MNPVEESPPTGPNETRPAATVPTLVFSINRRALWVLCFVVLAPWLLAAGWVAVPSLFKRSAPQVVAANVGKGDSSRSFRARSGPWGEIDLVRISVEPPDEFISTEVNAAPPMWAFVGYTRTGVEELLAGAPLTPEQRQALGDPSKWTDTPEAIVLRPDPQVVLALTRKARQIIYLALAIFPQNPAQHAAFVFHPQLLEERIERSGLTAESIVLLKSLLYRHGDVLLFADLSLALTRLADDHERVRFVKTVARSTTLLGALRITPDTDIEPLVNYWGFDGRAKDLRPLLESLRRIPGGATLDMAHLLPAFARRRLYTYPTPTVAAAGGSGSHWTSMNFFPEQPDDRYNDDATVARAIEHNYYQIASNMRLGDLVALVDAKGSIQHTAVFVADDIVFTRNGTRPNNPWQLMRVSELIDHFSPRTPPDQPLQANFYRLKQLGVLLAPN